MSALYSNYFSFSANSSGYNDANDTILIAGANTYLVVNDLIRYVVPTNNTAVEGLKANNAYYISFANSSAIALSETKDGSNVNIIGSNVGIDETHYIYLNSNVNSLLLDSNNNLTVQTLDSANSLNVSYTSADIQFNNLPVFFCRGWGDLNASSGVGSPEGTYSQSETTITVTIPIVSSYVQHNLQANDKIYAMFTSGTAVNNFFNVTSVTNTTVFTITSETSTTTNGSCILYRSDPHDSVMPYNALGNIRFVTHDANSTYIPHFSVSMPDIYYSVVSNAGKASANIMTCSVVNDTNTYFTITTFSNGIPTRADYLNFSVIK
jgi:hypothetical protein